MNRLSIATTIFLLASQTFAQEFRANISGKVTDSTGATVAGAEVVVFSLERNAQFRTVSNAASRYVLEFLPPGHYSLTADKPGFKKLVRSGLSLEAADHLSLDLALQIGDVNPDTSSGPIYAAEFPHDFS
jgi:hypothetical protein